MDKERDRARGFTVSPGGITVVGKGQDSAGVTAGQPAGRLSVALLTREYPPEVYGGAGVHVEYLARELAGLVNLTVHCQGEDRPGAVAHQAWDHLAGANQALQTISADLSMTAAVGRRRPGALAHLVREPGRVTWPRCSTGSRTWSPCTRWSRCGRGRPSSSAAATRCPPGASGPPSRPRPRSSRSPTACGTTCSRRTRPCPRERVRVIRNGIDTAEYSPDPATDVLERYGVDPARPSVVFVGRVTRQKGLPVLLRAAADVDPGGAARDLRRPGGHAGARGRGQRPGPGSCGRGGTGVVWISGMLAKREVIQLLTHATVFACPSLYEPLGIVNLEAMACGTAVVGSRVGGIPEVVADGKTGLLVPPGDPAALADADQRAA